MSDLGIAAWVIVALGMTYIGCRQVALWWRVQDLEHRVVELLRQKEEKG